MGVVSIVGLAGPVMVGAVGSFVVSRLLTPLLYGVSATDPTTLVATVALLEVYGLQRREDLKQAIDRALAYTCERQGTQGGWGYHGGDRGVPNSSMSG